MQLGTGGHEHADAKVLNEHVGHGMQVAVGSGGRLANADSDGSAVALELYCTDGIGDHDGVSSSSVSFGWTMMPATATIGVGAMLASIIASCSSADAATGFTTGSTDVSILILLNVVSSTGPVTIVVTNGCANSGARVWIACISSSSFSCPNWSGDVSVGCTCTGTNTGAGVCVDCTTSPGCCCANSGAGVCVASTAVSC